MRLGLFGAVFGTWGRSNRLPILGDVAPGTPVDPGGPTGDPGLELENTTGVLLLENGDRLLLE